ncbi:MAG TPA: hypothetical protein VFD82_15620 [Planctomycetota bacterium]|nr:hypothetical protein [Planctomycetota bacterium]
MAVFPAPIAGVLRRQARIVELFRDAGATSADRATTAAKLGLHEGLAFRQLRGHAVIQVVGEQGLFLDAARWEALLKQRRRIALTCVSIAVCILLGIVVTLLLSR